MPEPMCWRNARIRGGHTHAGRVLRFRLSFRVVFSGRARHRGPASELAEKAEISSRVSPPRDGELGDALPAIPLARRSKNAGITSRGPINRTKPQLNRNG